MNKLLIVFGDYSLASYPKGGGHWCVHLNYLLGLKDLGHKVVLLELMKSTGNSEVDNNLINLFFNRLKEYDLHDEAVVLMFDTQAQVHDINSATIYGMSNNEVKQLIKDSDLFFNFCAHIKQPLLGLFKTKALIDLDPGHLQVSALTVDMDIFDHDIFLTIGKKIDDPDCEIPNLNLDWITFFPFVYIPIWPMTQDPGIEAAFSSITSWGWGEIWLKNRVLSLSKRKAYLSYLELPKLSGRKFELSANISSKGLIGDPVGDTVKFRKYGWDLSYPYTVADSPDKYRQYISNSRAEISCPKPIYRELNTGWFSDRSVCYLASGRPVLAEDTGFSDHIPTGEGLLSFNNMGEAVEGVKEIDSNYKKHSNAARDLAEEYFSHKKVLPEMLDSAFN